jgi:hypothetical protein
MIMGKREEVLRGQARVCSVRGVPQFFPRNGICYACHRDLVPVLGDRLLRNPVTGCPICKRSFCD